MATVQEIFTGFRKETADVIMVVGVIGILMTILLPALKSARDQAKKIGCVNNMKQIFNLKMCYANDHEEYLPGLFCISAPIFNQTGKPYAAISVSGGFEFFSSNELDTISQQMKETAAEISQSMGYFHQATPFR